MTVVGKNLPARENGYDLMVLETDMQGNPRGDAVSYTHVDAAHIAGGELEVAVGVPGSLLKTNSVYTAYLVYVDEQNNDTAVASVRFKVSAGESQDTAESSATRRESKRALLQRPLPRRATTPRAPPPILLLMQPTVARTLPVLAGPIPPQPVRARRVPSAVSRGFRLWRKRALWRPRPMHPPGSHP